MNIMFCGDRNAALGILFCVTAICRNEKTPITFFILTANIDGKIVGLPREFSNILDICAKKGNRENKVYLFDISEVFSKYLPEANMSTRFTPACMLRLFSDMIADIPEKVLYLDTDVLCRKGFRDFYDTDISDIEIAGVPDRYGKWFFGNVFIHNYLNSGVLLMNMKKIRASGLFAKCRNLCRNKKMFMPDQSSLNKLAVKKKLPRKFNEQAGIRKDTVFKHFTTFFRFFPIFHHITIKPWEKEKMHNMLGIYEFDYLYEENFYE
ncbi:MAG: glycosyltransferase family 8 protein [Clostridia bacterium]|nr:glycosyltransferase family 8 protein [Clostridia bacterium]